MCDWVQQTCRLHTRCGHRLALSRIDNTTARSQTVCTAAVTFWKKAGRAPSLPLPTDAARCAARCAALLAALLLYPHSRLLHCIAALTPGCCIAALTPRCVAAFTFGLLCCLHFTGCLLAAFTFGLLHCIAAFTSQAACQQPSLHRLLAAFTFGLLAAFTFGLLHCIAAVHDSCQPSLRAACQQPSPQAAC